MKDDPVKVALIRARVAMLIHYPFLGTIATRIELRENNDWCKTVASDGRHFYYNRDYVLALTESQLINAIGHVTFHAMLLHFVRRGGRDPQLYDMACDFYVNALLTEMNCGDLPPGALFDRKYNSEDWTVESIYEDLKENSVEIKIPMDMHLDPEAGTAKGGGEGGEDGEASVRVFGNGDGPPVLSQSEIDQITEDMRQAMVQAVQVAGAGQLPKGMARYVNSLTEAKKDWREEINAHVQSAYKNDMSFQRYNRRNASLGVILPGLREQEMIEVAVAIDTSGSMSEGMIRDMLSEVKGIMQQFDDFKLHLWTFDTEVHAYQEFTPDNADEIDTYVPGGGGGTVFVVNWDFMREKEIMPDRFLMFTDGYPWGGGEYPWGDPNYVDTLFLIHGTKSIVAPFGQTSYYEFNDPKYN